MEEGLPVVLMSCDLAASCDYRAVPALRRVSRALVLRDWSE